MRSPNPPTPFPPREGGARARKSFALPSLRGKGAGGLGLLLLLTGCTPPKPAPSPPPLIVSPNLRVALTISPAPLRQLDLSVFTVTVTDKNQRPVKEGNVKMELTMPTMAMPENVVMPKQMDAGTWVGAGRFTMAGEWRVTVTAATKNGGDTTRIFPVTVK